MAKKVTNNKIESFGKTNYFLVLLFNTMAGLFLGVGHVMAFDVYVSAVPDADPERGYMIMSKQLLVAFIVVFAVSLVLGVLNKKAIAKKSKGTYVIFGLLMLLIVALLIGNIAVLIELF